MFCNWSLLAMYVHVVVAPMEYYLSLDWQDAQLVDHEQFLYYWLYTLIIIHIFVELDQDC